MATIDLTGVEFVKKANMSPLTGSWVPGGEDDVECQTLVRNMLAEIREGGEEACKGFAKKLDNYTGPILLTEEDIEEQTKDIAEQVTVIKDIAITK